MDSLLGGRANDGMTSAVAIGGKGTRGRPWCICDGTTNSGCKDKGK